MNLSRIGFAFLFSVSVAAHAHGDDIAVSINPHAHWQFKSVNVYSSDSETIVSGRLTGGRLARLPKGHIDYKVIGPDGKLIMEATSKYTPATLSYHARKKGGLRFYTEFTPQLPAGSIVKLAFHEDPRLAPEKPPHATNIAE